MAKFAIFVDLENCGAKVPTLNSILEKVKIRGDILLGKVYGYTDRFSDLKELLLSNTFTVVPSLRYGIAQKNNADIQLVVDALEVAFTNVPWNFEMPEVDPEGNAAEVEFSADDIGIDSADGTPVTVTIVNKTESYITE